ncbi:hypothetical protein ACS0TY_017835 [Phlomoides rotata]
MRSQVAEKFSDFFEKWMSQLEHLLQLLVIVSKMKVSNSEETSSYSYTSIINKLTSHHKEYYKFKWALAHDDILSFFSAPIWLTPLENAHLWVTGWKPSMAFRLVESLRRGGSGTGLSLVGLTDEQAKKIEGLRGRMKAEEDRVEREMERLQVSVADRKTVEMVRLEKQGGNEAVKVVEGGLEKVMKMADCVRLKTLKGLLDILSPMQGVDFLAYEAMVEIRVRKLGKLERRRRLMM